MSACLYVLIGLHVACLAMQIAIWRSNHRNMVAIAELLVRP